MNSRNKSFCLPVVFSLALGGPVATAAEVDIARGEEKSQVCIACHGQQGISQQDNYPHLHGQRQTYLLRQLRTFRDGGDRRDPIMTPMLENMSDQDLQNLAAYFSSFNTVLGTDAQAGKAGGAPMSSPAIEGRSKDVETASDAAGGQAAAPAEEPVQAPVAAGTPVQAVAAGAGNAESGKTKSAACAACHGADGRGTTPLFPNLNGQKPEYLTVQLKAFREGRRTDPTMVPMAMPLSDQDIADLAAFYGGLK